MSVPVSDLQEVAPSAIIELFELELNTLQHGTTEIYRFHAGTSLNANGEVVWAGNSYQRFPVEADEFEYAGNGQLPRPKIRIANVLGTITALLLTLPEGLEGAKVTRIRTLARYLDAVNFPDSVNPYGTPDPTAEFPQEIYYVDRKTNETRDVVEFELGAAFDLAGVRAPKRQCVSNICQWVYRSTECGYAEASYYDENDQPVTSAAADVCGKRLSSCETRFLPFTRSAQLTTGSTSVTLNSTTGIIATMPISGFGIPSSSTVTAVNSGTVITTSQAATLTTNLAQTGTPSATAASMTVTSATGIIAGVTVSGTYLPAGTTVLSVSGTTLTLNQRPYSFARSGTYESVYNIIFTGYGRSIENIDVSGIVVGMRVFGTNGINTTVATVGSGTITLNSYGSFPSTGEQTASVTLYFMPASPGSATYTFAEEDVTATFRNTASDGIPFGSFPGIGTYFS